MKKLILSIFSIFILLFGACPVFTTQASTEKTFYAKVQRTGVMFCSSPSEQTSLFEIPYSYFVKVDHVVDDYLKVTYDNLEGYVKKEEVSLMECTPITPYAKATYKLFVPYALYENADTTSSIIPLDETVTITYYGTKTGQQVMSNNNIWYYSSIKLNNETHFGYVFSGVTDLLTKIEVNNELYEIVSEEVLSPQAPNFSGLSVGTKVMLIISISIPSLLILYFLIKPTKIMQVTKNRKRVKKEVKRVSHGDYFEFDESEL